MLDSETKRRIDTARDILVGKVPDPKSQVEQITIALIYKFMDDMDAEAEEMGGKRKFFTGDYARYGWAKLMRAGLGGHEMLNLYGEAIAKMPENPGIPTLFRDIFKNAYLPYRDPETLKSFLKIIDEFAYDHSERLGDAFEYLLSVLGSQGDAGQFRTPRHIIDFIVRVVDPKKDETILDPACGTAGFLISSYKHILRSNTDAKGNATLTPDERGRLAANLKGYDISPDMVRLSLVNLYLHGFNNPRIDEYDTLTSEEKWNEFADVILANPPFMSPKGGIKPHKRFGVQSKRSEVLFVDYMAEHLTPAGRAGIIVPEGIIFQSQGAYKELRKMLVDNSLVAVLSLPAGVFNPYSGVKTSILILDKSLARQADSIAFFKVENDGFGLGAQRREIEKNDLPQVEAEIAAYLGKLRARETVAEMELRFGLVVPKARIAANGDYNLSGKRYREGLVRASRYPIVRLGEVAEVVAGQSPPGESYNETGTGIPFYQGKTEFGEMFIGAPTKWTTDPQRFAEAGDILISVRAPVGPVNLATQRLCIGRGLAAIRPAEGKMLSSYAFYLLRSQEEHIKGDDGAVFASINRGEIEELKIPLPPLEVQREIVGEIEGYQRVIDGARSVLDNYRPHIPIDPEWPVVALGDVCEWITKGTTPTTDGHKFQTSGVSFIKIESISECGEIDPRRVAFIDEACYSSLKRSQLMESDILFSIAGTRMGITGFVRRDILPANTNQALAIVRVKNTLHPRFAFNYLRSDVVQQAIEKLKVGVAQFNLSLKQVSEIMVPLPSLETQQAIVAEIEAEQRLVAANRELVERFEAKIQATLARVWGEEPAPEAEEEEPSAPARRATA
jgi:type I restriction enzyme M protein